MATMRKILIVDDSELIHNMYRLILQRFHGCHLVEAMNGREALDKLALESDIDLVLLDINMPVMNGIQFLESVHSDGRIAKLPIIIVSTEGKEEDTLRGLSLGARGYVVKPFKPSTLLGLIDAVVNQKTGAPT
jgi:two-component system, chemotaxis family, chemotaxis protein CheY